MYGTLSPEISINGFGVITVQKSGGVCFDGSVISLRASVQIGDGQGGMSPLECYWPCGLCEIIIQIRMK